MSTTKRKKSTTRRKKNANTVEVERTVSPLKISIQGEEFEPDQIPSELRPEPDTHEVIPSEEEPVVKDDEGKEDEGKDDEMVIITRKKKSNPEEFESSMREEKPKRFLRELKKPKLSPTGGRISPTRRIITATSEEEEEIFKPVKRVSWDKSVVQKDLERMDERLREEEEEREREKQEKEEEERMERQERERQEEQERLEKEEREREEERERQERERLERQEEEERLERERLERQEEEERLERERLERQEEEERLERERLERQEEQERLEEIERQKKIEEQERKRQEREREERERQEREREERERQEREMQEREQEERERQEREKQEEERKEQETRRERAERRERERREQEERERKKRGDEHLNRMMGNKLEAGGFFERKPEIEMSRIEELEQKIREYEERERLMMEKEKENGLRNGGVKDEDVEKKSPQMPPRRQEPPTTYSPLNTVDLGERQISNERHQTTGLPTPPPENTPENQWNGEKPILYKKVYMEDNTTKSVPQKAPLPFATNWKRPQYHLMDARQRYSYYDDFRIKYGLLNQQLPPDMQIPMFVPGEDLNIVHDRYERYLCQVLGHDEASMWNFILVLIYKGIEFVGTWLGIPCSGFTMYMAKKKHKMRNLLIQMGEQKYLTFSASWPVPAQILWTVVSSLAVFIVYGIIGKKFGDTGMKIAQEAGDYLLEMGSSKTVGVDANGVPIIKEGDPAFSDGPLNTISNFLEGDGANDMISNIFGMFKGRGASNAQKPAGGATNQGRSSVPDINVDEIRRRKKEEEVLF